MSTHFYAACREHKVYACVGVSTAGHWWSGSGSKDKEGAELAYRFIWEHNFCGIDKATGQGLLLWDEHVIDRLEQKSDDWTEIEIAYYRSKAQCRICGKVYEGEHVLKAQVCCAAQKSNEDPHGLHAKSKANLQARAKRHIDEKKRRMEE